MVREGVSTYDVEEPALQDGPEDREDQVQEGRRVDDVYLCCPYRLRLLSKGSSLSHFISSR